MRRPLILTLLVLGSWLLAACAPPDDEPRSFLLGASDTTAAACYWSVGVDPDSVNLQRIEVRNVNTGDVYGKNEWGPARRADSFPDIARQPDSIPVQCAYQAQHPDGRLYDEQTYDVRWIRPLAQQPPPQTGLGGALDTMVTVLADDLGGTPPSPGDSLPEVPEDTLPTPEPPDTTAGGSNEPAGYTTISERDWTRLATCRDVSTRIDGWDDLEGCGLTQVSDPTAPRSAPTVLRATFPQGKSAGSGAGGPAQRVTDQVSNLYIRLWIRLSDPWEGHSSKTNKVAFFQWINNQPAIFPSAEGSGSGNLEAQLRLQGVPDSRTRLTPNVRPAIVERGRWYQWEFIFECRTSGSRLRWYIDGALITDYDDINLGSSSCRFETFQMRQIWGGTGGSNRITQTIDFDHVYLSGQ